MEFNVQQAPFDDVKVRTAMNYAIDKDVLVQVALRGLGIPAYGVLPPSIWGYWDGIEEYAPHYDAEKALALFKEAGWERDSDGTMQKDGEPFAFTLYTAPIDTWTQSAQIVQQQLAELGITMDIQTFEFGTMLDKLKAGEQQADFMGYTYTSPDIVYLWFDSSQHRYRPGAQPLCRRNIGRPHRNVAHRDRGRRPLGGLRRNPEGHHRRSTLGSPLDQRKLPCPATRHRRREVHPDGFLVLMDAWLK